MKRLFTFILYILLIIAIILIIAWMRARKVAQQEGTQAPSFRQFLGLGTTTPTTPGETPGTGLIPDFTTDTDGIALDEGMEGTGSVTVSQFTSGPQSPTQSGITQYNNQGTTSVGELTGTGLPISSITPSAGIAAPAPAPVSGQYQCTDADINIQFTPEEITRLNALQNRFYAIAGILHTDADVETELVNYDQFTAKTDEITELYNYCVGKSPLITQPLYATRITTPYWRDASKDSAGYVAGSYSIFGLGSWVQLDSRRWDPRNVQTSHGVLEQIFRVNLW